MSNPPVHWHHPSIQGGLKDCGQSSIISTFASLSNLRCIPSGPDDLFILRKKFLYISPLKAQDKDLTMTQRNEVQDKKQTAFIDLDAVWNIKRNVSLGDLKTARSSLSSTNKYYSRYGGCRAYSGTGPNIHKLPRTMESNPDRKWSSKSKEKLGNRSAHNSLSEED